MKARLTEDKLWRGRLYLKGDRDIPADLAAALGAATHDETAPSEGNSNQMELPSDDSGTPESETLKAPPALSLLNSAQNLEELLSYRLPGIGQGRGRKLLSFRPATGFLSLDQAASMLGDKQVDWGAIATWEPPNGSEA